MFPVYQQILGALTYLALSWLVLLVFIRLVT